jgi:Domain of unknown function (DUF4932)
MKNIFLSIILLTTLISFGQAPQLEISIDERVETLYTVAFLNNYFLVSNHQSEYTHLIMKDLLDLKNHKAVKLFDTLSKKHHFTFYRPVEWILQYSDFPQLEKIYKKTDDLPQVSDNKEYMLDEFRNELKKFYNDSLYQKYIRNIKEYNLKTIEKVKQSPTIEKLPTYLENYYGKKLGSYNLILSPLVHSGGFNSEIIDREGKLNVYATIGPNGEIDFIPVFDKDYLEMDMVLHEFGHSYVNPLMDKYEKKIEKLKEKYFTEKLKLDAENEGYTGWKYVFNELLLRATTIKITEKNFGKDKANELIEYEKSVGFGLVENIVEILRLYENNRDKYPTFDEFYPVLLKKMK